MTFFDRRGGKAAVAIALGCLLYSTASLAFDRETLVDSGQASNRINLFILGDGYTSSETATLRAEAVKASDLLFAQPFLAPYKPFINVVVIYSTSSCSGARNGALQPVCTTVFDSYFNCGGIDRLLCLDYNLLTQVLATDAPEYTFSRDMVLISVNDTKYGGAGGSYATFSRDSTGPYIAIHELGHSFAGLADEYEEGRVETCPLPDCSEPNVTSLYQRDMLKWSAWVQPSTPLPTPATDENASVVGAFEGAKYSSTGIYRPRLNCTMRSLFVPDCEVCSEAWIEQIWDSVRRIETTSPSSPLVSVAQGSSQVFAYTGPKTSPATLTQAWKLDGAQVGTAETYTLDGCAVAVGSHSLVLENTDPTTIVRDDALSLRTESTTGHLTVTAGATDAATPARASRRRRRGHRWRRCLGWRRRRHGRRRRQRLRRQGRPTDASVDVKVGSDGPMPDGASDGQSDAADAAGGSGGAGGDSDGHGCSCDLGGGAGAGQLASLPMSPGDHRRHASEARPARVGTEVGVNRGPVPLPRGLGY